MAVEDSSAVAEAGKTAAVAAEGVAEDVEVEETDATLDAHVLRY